MKPAPVADNCSMPRPFVASQTTNWPCWHSTWPRRLIAIARPPQFPEPDPRSAEWPAPSWTATHLPIRPYGFFLVSVTGSLYSQICRNINMEVLQTSFNCLILGEILLTRHCLLSALHLVCVKAENKPRDPRSNTFKGLFAVFRILIYKGFNAIS